MATRNPTKWTRWTDHEAISPGKPLLASLMDNLIDDQEYALDAQLLVISDCFARIECVSTPAVTVGVYNLDSKDMCDVSGISNDEFQHDVSFYAWVSDGATNGSIVLTSGQATADASSTLTLTGTPTTPTWSSFDAMNIKTNANQDDLTLTIERTGGSGTVYLAGVAVFAKIT